MRFMVIVKASKDSEGGKMPDNELLTAMGKYNEELSKAGVLLDLSGLHPSSNGSRVKFEADGKRSVIDGPFPETKELIAGFWLLQCKSRAECVEWVKRAPMEKDAVLEIRQVFDIGDFEMSGEALATHERVGEALKAQGTAKAAH
jgi:hypothetical protein